MVKVWLATALVTGALALSGCAEGVLGKGDRLASGWVEEAGRGLELAFAEPTDLVFEAADPDLIREPASSADLALPPDFDPMIDALPLAQDSTEVATTDEEGREVATDVFDDSLMTDDGVLPPRSEEEAPMDEDDAAVLP